MARAFFKFLFVNLGFFILTCYMVVSNEMQKIKNQWPMYRCNPAYMFMADNIAENFNYCIDQSGASAFNKFSGKLNDLQESSLKGQNLGTNSLGSFLKSNNATTGGLSLSLGKLMDMGGKISVLGSVAGAYGGDIGSKTGTVVSGVGGLLKAGADGADIVGKTFGKVIGLF